MVAISFCWGVYIAAKIATTYGEIVGLVGMHPSLGLATRFNEDPADLVRHIKCPLFLMPSGDDPANVKEGGELATILKERFGESVGSVEFPTEKHGWVVRADVSDPERRQAVQKAI